MEQYGPGILWIDLEMPGAHTVWELAIPLCSH